MSTSPPQRAWPLRNAPGIVALALMVITFMIGQLPAVSSADTDRLASTFKFEPMSVSLPGGYQQKEIRQVNKEYQHIDAWISSVGAAMAINDLDGDGLANDMCTVDTRIDQAVVTPVPGTGDRYLPFALNPSPLPMNPYIAPMGCLPGDFNEDGRTDLMVYYWGRTPVLFMAKANATKVELASYVPTELVPGRSESTYSGPQWNTNAVAFDDFDGDGHDDLLITNYFPDGPVLNPNVDGGVAMNHSMSNAQNGGEDHFFLCKGMASGDHPSATYQQVDDALPNEVSRGWELGAAADDLDGDGLPELYLANDFGPDRLLYNQSTPGHLKFKVVTGEVTRATTPKSKRLGHDSFKGMGADFGDLNGDGRDDIFVSNITTTFGIEESNFHYLNTSSSDADMHAKLDGGNAPFVDHSGDLGDAWTGWGWDAKIGDFNNSGANSIAQTSGFVKGHVNRWPQLQELATANDNLLSNPWWWPKVNSGDDIGGSQRLHFWVRMSDGRFADLAPKLGIDVPVPTRGIATADVDGDGRLDFAVARQWDAPAYYHNESTSDGSYLELNLMHDESAQMMAETAGAFPQAGSPVIGAQVRVTTEQGHVYSAHVDGGSGHSGKRSNEIHIGLGGETGPLHVDLSWRDRDGQMHKQTVQLNPGRHTLLLGSQAKEK